MRDRGFTLVELLIALLISVLIGSIVASAVPSARAAFERIPADLDLQQRGRSAVTLLSQELRAATHVVLSVPRADGTASELTVIVPFRSPSRGLLEFDQSTSTSAMRLAATPCPNFGDVCGFGPGTVATIAAADGAFDVFEVASSTPAERGIAADRALSRAYAAGSIVTEVDVHTYRLDRQPDGSQSLVRITAAGAVQPVVDFVSAIAFTIVADDRIVVSLTVQPPPGSVGHRLENRVFTTAVAMRNAS